MLNGNSISKNSPSSILAESFLVASGISRVIQSQVTGPRETQDLIKKYSNKLQKYASSIPAWAPFAKSLSVDVNSKGKVSVRFNGSEEDRQVVELLEYGTPGSPPESVIRVMETELQQDYSMDTRGAQ